MFSIPRDTWVYIPNWRYTRINLADSHGEAEQFPGRRAGPGGAKRCNTTSAFPVQYYARVDFNGFKHLIDSAGGVDVMADCPLYDIFPDNPDGRHRHRLHGNHRHDRYSGGRHLSSRRQTCVVVCALAQDHQRLRSIAPPAARAARPVGQGQSAGHRRSAAHAVGRTEQHRADRSQSERRAVSGRIWARRSITRASRAVSSTGKTRIALPAKKAPASSCSTGTKSPPRCNRRSRRPSPSRPVNLPRRSKC